MNENTIKVSMMIYKTTMKKKKKVAMFHFIKYEFDDLYAMLPSEMESRLKLAVEQNLEKPYSGVK